MGKWAKKRDAWEFHAVGSGACWFGLFINPLSSEKKTSIRKSAKRHCRENKINTINKKNPKMHTAYRRIRMHGTDELHNNRASNNKNRQKWKIQEKKNSIVFYCYRL